MIQQKLMQVDELTKPGWVHAPDYFRGRDMMCSTSELLIPVVVQPHMDNDEAATAPATFGENMDCLDIDGEVTQMPQVTSRPGCSHMRLCSVEPLTNMSIFCLAPATQLDSIFIQIEKPVEVVNFDHCI